MPQQAHVARDPRGSHPRLAFGRPATRVVVVDALHPMFEAELGLASRDDSPLVREPAQHPALLLLAALVSLEALVLFRFPARFREVVRAAPNPRRAFMKAHRV